jgi:hypothetical protein
MDIIFNDGLQRSLILVVIVLMGVEGRVWFRCCVYECLLWCLFWMFRLYSTILICGIHRSRFVLSRDLICLIDFAVKKKEVDLPFQY